MDDVSVADEMEFEALPIETRRLAIRVLGARLRPTDTADAWQRDQALGEYDTQLEDLLLFLF